MAEEIMSLMAQIVSAHLQRNTVAADELPTLIRDVYQTLTSLAGVENESESTPEPVAQAAAQPAVPITKSVFNDHIVCLEDGKSMTMLKRHLMTEHNMTVEQYRTKWGLPSNYPTVAPSYALTRSNLAKKMGLGRAAQAKRGGRKAAARRTAD